MILEKERFAILDDVLYYIDPGAKQHLRVSVPESLQQTVWRRRTLDHLEDILLLEVSLRLCHSDGGGMVYPVMYTDFVELA